MPTEISLCATRNVGEPLRRELAASLEAPDDRQISLGWYEQRSAGIGEIITLITAWKVAGIVADELIREAVRASLRTIRFERQTHRGGLGGCAD